MYKINRYIQILPGWKQYNSEPNKSDKPNLPWKCAWVCALPSLSSLHLGPFKDLFHHGPWNNLMDTAASTRASCQSTFHTVRMDSVLRDHFILRTVKVTASHWAKPLGNHGKMPSSNHYLQGSSWPGVCAFSPNPSATDALFTVLQPVPQNIPPKEERNHVGYY